MNFSRVLKVALTVALLAVVGAFVLQAFPAVVGADYALIVQSGSMEPAIQTGSVVFVKDVPAERVEAGDVITYGDDGGNLITHRVIERHTTDTSIRFITKGDANENADHEPVYRSNLVGVVMFNIPLIGYVVAFGNTPAGYMALVLVPVMLFIFNELWELWKAGTRNEKHT
ncbi:signal peptidase I [Halorubrum sp. CBA1125]|uniref:signal peptidase I n=1 Tax=Halorubrum sp. CBA1125 TaxID=2668072 RepID=UPI0012E7A95C|nr:signal peptidase I [Halorubrum sp. CBA1125]MUW15478.1 signal peptidase I [Halorubrum sp. CBA1125]